MATINSWPAAPAAMDREIDRYVAAFEQCFRGDGDAAIEWFLPAPHDRLFLPVLRELVRVDLEYRWTAGRPVPLETYRSRFPELFADRGSLREVVFEEFRLRRQAGEIPTPEEYRRQYGVEPAEGEEDEDPDPASADPPAQRVEDLCGDEALRADAALRRGGTEDGAAPGEPAPVRAFAAAARDGRAASAADLPEVGATVAGFYLISELGRGAFARVFLARQADLAGRLVALKVTAGGDGGEARKLAQLQHTNVVPVYSVHREGRLRAVCMPYFGPTTLAHVLDALKGSRSLPASGQGLHITLQGRRSTQVASRAAPGGSHPGVRSARPDEPDPGPPLPTPAAEAPAPATTATLEMLAKLSFVEAVLWVGARLADGLAHAHERGILHRDIKPQNVLLTEDGQPMLLDFNLAQDEKDLTAGVKAQMGGTLPYMAPEHLEAFRGTGTKVDARGDLYALGVVLFELLAGRPPFEPRQGALADILDPMLADRRAAPPLRRLNPVVPPAVGAIVGKLLAYDPDDRYPTARHLAEDLERQLTHRPLRHAPNPSWRERAAKWRRRHPRLSSTLTVVAVAGAAVAVMTAALLGYRREVARRDATAQVARDQADLLAAEFYFLPWADRTAQTPLGHDLAGRVLDRYGVGRDPNWHRHPTLTALRPEDRDRWRTELGQMLLLQSGAGLRSARAAHQRRDAPASEEQAALALAANRRAEDCFPDPPAFLYEQRAELLHLLGRPDEAREAADRGAARADPADGFGHVARLAQRAAEERFEDAVPGLQALTCRHPTNNFAWFALGYCHAALGQLDKADACYTACVSLQPALPWAYLNRGQVRYLKKEYRPALVDFDTVVRLQPDLAEGYIRRATARGFLEPDPDGPLQDLGAALRCGGPACHIHFLRSRLYAKAGNRAEAARAEEEALRATPTGELDWFDRGTVHLNRKGYEAALADFDQALRFNPRSLRALQNKAHVLSDCLPRAKEAREVLDQLVTLYPDFLEGWVGRGVLRARLGDVAGAHADAEHCRAVRQQKPSPLLLYQLACLYAQTSVREPADRRTALDLLRQAFRDGFDRTDLLDHLLDRDDDLKPLFNEPEFQRLVRAARELYAWRN
jgi:serine/threonine protein kinase/tetratricopeptide (TPR) repeat protein